MKADPTTVSAGVVPFDPAPPDGGRDYAEGGTIALTYRELADRLGVAVEAAKARARRGGWTRLPGNDGLVRVRVPTEALRAPREAPHAPPRPGHPAPEAGLPLVALRAALDAQAEAHRAELARLDTAHRAELERMEQAYTRELIRLQEVTTQETQTAQLALTQATVEAQRGLRTPGLRGWLVRWLTA